MCVLNWALPESNDNWEVFLTCDAKYGSISRIKLEDAERLITCPFLQTESIMIIQFVVCRRRRGSSVSTVIKSHFIEPSPFYFWMIERKQKLAINIFFFFFSTNRQGQGRAVLSLQNEKYRPGWLLLLKSVQPKNGSHSLPFSFLYPFLASFCPVFYKTKTDGRHPASSPQCGVWVLFDSFTLTFSFSMSQKQTCFLKLSQLHNVTNFLTSLYRQFHLSSSTHQSYGNCNIDRRSYADSTAKPAHTRVYMGTIWLAFATVSQGFGRKTADFAKWPRFFLVVSIHSISHTRHQAKHTQTQTRAKLFRSRFFFSCFVQLLVRLSTGALAETEKGETWKGGRGRKARGDPSGGSWKLRTKKQTTVCRSVGVQRHRHRQF